jgi:hypothetical protein
MEYDGTQLKLQLQLYCIIHNISFNTVNKSIARCVDLLRLTPHSVPQYLSEAHVKKSLFLFENANLNLCLPVKIFPGKKDWVG